MKRVRHLIRVLKDIGARRVLFLGASVLILVSGIVFFSARVHSEFQKLSITAADSVQWNMSQAEVEHLLLNLDLVNAMRDPEPDLDQVRQSFNVFYSRITTLEEGE